MTGRRISKTSHRMSGEVFVVRAVPSVTKVSDTHLAEATARDRTAIDKVKEDLKSATPRPTR